MAFDKYVLCRKNEKCVVEDQLSRKQYGLNEVVDLLNELDHRYDEIHDKQVQVFVKEYKTTRWKDEHSHTRLELLTSLADQLGIEL